jgi:hypothetical protein
MGNVHESTLSKYGEWGVGNHIMIVTNTRMDYGVCLCGMDYMSDNGVQI